MRQPPGRTTEITCRTALVLAPHPDDEVLGCGGLVARLVGESAAVHVLFLTDGAAGGDRDRRRQEASAVARLLGIAGVEHLDFPDGGLEQQVEELAAAFGETLERLRPELLLVPSPLESSADHRAAFGALHKLLAGVRPGQEREAALRDLRVLVYEVNHPFYPDVLVDVSEQLPRLEEAMALYSSQQERHDYLAAALGLKRFRTLTLPAGVTAAEAFVDLRLPDFTTRSPAQLIRHLGGEPAFVEVRQGPKISVVVRTRDRPRLLAEALESLAAGTYRRAEVVLVNDGGEKPSVPADFPLEVVTVDLAPNRGRAGAATAGIEAATGDCVTFLDDDDLAAPEHLATLAALAGAAGVRVAYSDAAVGVYELDAEGGWRCRERRLPYSRDFDAGLLLVDNYIPFNTLIFERALLREVGPLDDDLPFFEDWDLLIRLSRRTAFHHLAEVTCEYRHFRGGGHHVFGENPRQRADFLEVKARVLAKHGAALTPPVLAAAVDRLRGEAVEAGEALRTAEHRLKGKEEELSRLNGRLVAFEGDHRRLESAYAEVSGEVQRLHSEERELRQVLEEHEEHLGRTYAEIERLTAEARSAGAALEEHRQVVADQSEHLERTYAEIRRLNDVIRTMEETRAWRVHSWLQQRRS